MTEKLTGDLGPEDAIPKAFECFNKSLMFGPDGHLYTTFRISEFAGVDPQISYILAYFSQYPDIDKNYDAFTLWKNPLNWVGDKSDWKDFILSKLHSLHGGGSEQIKERKEKLANLIKQFISKKEYWKAGVLIHSLGDAYAHTKDEINSASEEAYGVKMGHGLDTILGKDPDDLARTIVKKKYIEYVNHLFSILSLENADKTGLQLYCDSIDVTFCTNKACPTFQVLNDKDVFYVDRFTKCMNQNMRSLTPQEVEKLLIQI